MTPSPRLSVIVPAFQGERLLPRTLAALVASDLPRDSWELLVVDDGSTDGTSRVASSWADQVVTLPGPPRGPGHARNRGAAAARGEWLVFVDADVVVHPETLRRIDTVTRGPDDVAAVFGTYDDSPPAPGLVSQFRNLLHRYVHISVDGDAGTFWAGCGAVRRSAFLAIGGFDEVRYPRPQIEDIDLGYRLRDQGGRILIDSGIQGAHLKRWTFMGGVRTDLVDRGIPWVRLLLERGGLADDSNLNLKRGERFKTALVGLGLAMLPAAGWLGPAAAALGAGILLLALLLDLPVLRWFARERGFGFVLAAAPLMLWYHFISGLAVILGAGAHLLRLGPRRPARPARAPTSSRPTLAPRE